MSCAEQLANADGLISVLITLGTPAVVVLTLIVRDSVWELFTSLGRTKREYRRQLHARMALLVSAGSDPKYVESRAKRQLEAEGQHLLEGLTQ